MIRRRHLSVFLLPTVWIILGGCPPSNPGGASAGDGSDASAYIGPGSLVGQPDSPNVQDGEPSGDGTDASGIEPGNQSDADTDGDGLPDNQEWLFLTDPSKADTDGDGLSDGREVELGTNPRLQDSDADSLTDGEEVDMGTNPLAADTDGNGLTDGREVHPLFGSASDPLNPDTDADGLSDGEEWSLYSDPLKPDTDGDGLTDGREAELGTSPIHADTDYDGLTDADEVSRGTNPVVADTDGDGLRDGTELDPLFGSDPLNPDTDADGIRDGAEVDLRLDLLKPNAVVTFDEAICNDFVVLSGNFVWESWGLGDFDTWHSGDAVAIGTGSLANLDRWETQSVTSVGQVVRHSAMSEKASDNSWVKLLDGTRWSVSSLDRLHVSLWLVAQPVLVVSDATVWHLLNTSQCEMIDVTPL